MRQIKSHILCGMSLLLMPFALSPVQAQEHTHERSVPDLVFSAGEYMHETSSTLGGTVTATPVEGSSEWILTPVPDDPAKWRFVQWSDGNTDNPRTVSVTELSATYTAEFTRFIYTNCYATGEYSSEQAATRGGSVTATPVEGSSEWILTPVPVDDTKWRFLQWNDGNTDNPRTVSVTDLAETYTATFQRFIYTDCYSPGEFMLDNVHNTDTGTIAVTEVDGVWQLEAQPEPGYTFAQWADGNAENPRVFEPSASATSTSYATFIPTATIGKIDFWRKDGLVITTDYPTDLEDGSFGGVTVFYDGQLMSSAVPDFTSDYSEEPQVDFGVYLLRADYAASHAGKKCHVVYKNTSCVPVATLDTVIPFLIDGEETVSADGLGAGVHVLRGGVATFASSQEITDLDIYAGGKAIIENDADVTVSSVTMRADAMTYFAEGSTSSAWEYPVLYPDLAVQGTLVNENSDRINFDYRLDYSAYYPFSLPAAVNTAVVNYRSGVSARDHFVLGTYNGAKRANEQNGWETCYDFAAGVGDEPTYSISAGKGYNIYAEPVNWNPDDASVEGDTYQEFYGGVIRFPMTMDLSSGESAKSISVEQHDALHKEYMNWNIIASPYLTAYQGTITLYKDDDPLIDEATGEPQELGYVAVPIDNFKDYEVVPVTSVTFYPFHSYLTQFEGDANKLVFESPNPSARAAAPRRRAAQAKSNKKLKAGLTLTQNGRSDHAGVLIGERYTNNYDVNADMVKMEGYTDRIKLFSLAGSQKLAYMAIPPADGSGVLETIIPLGYDSARVGNEMKFAADLTYFPYLLDDEDIIALELVDYAAGLTTDLLENDYTCTAAKKSDNTRFALNVRYRAPQQQETYTGLEETEPRATALPDGLYDLLGRRVENNSARNAGIYIVVENGRTRKEVIR